jgi:hypothetical protein
MDALKTIVFYQMKRFNHMLVSKIKPCMWHGSSHKKNWCKWELPQEELVSMAAPTRRTCIHGVSHKQDWYPWEHPQVDSASAYKRGVQPTIQAHMLGKCIWEPPQAELLPMGIPTIRIGVNGSSHKKNWCPWQLPQAELVYMACPTSRIGILGSTHK